MEMDDVGVLEEVMERRLDGGSAGAEGPDGGHEDVLGERLAGLHIGGQGGVEEPCEAGAVDFEELLGPDAGELDATGLDVEAVSVLDRGVAASEKDVRGVGAVVV